jgi:hypothetical protein
LPIAPELAVASHPLGGAREAAPHYRHGVVDEEIIEHLPCPSSFGGDDRKQPGFFCFDLSPLGGDVALENYRLYDKSLGKRGSLDPKIDSKIGLISELSVSHSAGAKPSPTSYQLGAARPRPIVVERNKCLASSGW